MIIIINLCLMRMAGNTLRLFLIILVFSNFFFLDAVPILPSEDPKLIYLSINLKNGTISVLVHAESLLCFVITGRRNLLHASQDIVASRSIHRVYDQILPCLCTF